MSTKKNPFYGLRSHKYNKLPPSPAVRFHVTLGFFEDAGVGPIGGLDRRGGLARASDEFWVSVIQRSNGKKSTKMAKKSQNMSKLYLNKNGQEKL